MIARRWHFSMLRSYTAADACTIGNAACGTIAIGALRLGPARLHPLALVYGVSASAMISATLRVPKP